VIAVSLPCRALTAVEGSSKVTATRKTLDMTSNRFLGLLTTADYGRLRPHLKSVRMKYRKPLYPANTRIDFVWFIEPGVGSVIITMVNDNATEVGTIGCSVIGRTVGFIRPGYSSGFTCRIRQSSKLARRHKHHA